MRQLMSLQDWPTPVDDPLPAIEDPYRLVKFHAELRMRCIEAAAPVRWEAGTLATAQRWYDWVINGKKD